MSCLQVWELWHSYKRKPYPGTLYVTLNETTPTVPQATPTTTRSMDPTQPVSKIVTNSTDNVCVSVVYVYNLCIYMHTNFYVYILYVQEVGGESVEQMMGRLHGQTHNTYVTITCTLSYCLYTICICKKYTLQIYCTPY